MEALFAIDITLHVLVATGSAGFRCNSEDYDSDISVRVVLEGL
jgi:hypothetical protein